MMSNATRNKVLGYLTSFYDSNGYSPSYREIADAIGVKSTSTVHKYVHILESEGFLDTYRQRSRSLSLNRSVSLPAASGKSIQRILLKAADGGMLMFDCSAENNNGKVALNFGGIIDATRMKGSVSQIISCCVDSGD